MNITPVIVRDDVVEGNRLGPILLSTGVTLQDGDVVVVASKVVAKAEGRTVEFDDIDALIRAQSRRVLRVRGDLMITETHHGFVCANAGIDLSNTPPGTAVLLPKDPDRSAHVLRNELRAHGGVEVATVVIDTAGRAWREGVIDQALGCAGLRPIDDIRGTSDAFGNELTVTQVCVADQIAAAAGLMMNKSARTPFVIVRGLDSKHFGEGSIARDVVRRYSNDLFR